MVEIDDRTDEQTTDIDPVTERRNWLVSRWFDAREAIKKHEEVLKETTQLLIEELGVGGRHEAHPGVGVKVQGPTSRFNDELAREVLTPEQYASICEAKPSSKLAAQLLPGVLVDQCKAPATAPSVREL